MSDVRKEDLVRLSAKRELTPEDESRLESYFSADPRARAEWEEERALSRAVQSLPDLAVSSNFTARVLHEVDLAESTLEREHSRPAWWQRIWPKLGWATAAILLTTLGVQYRAAQKEKIIVDLVRISDIATPGPEALQDFEVINRLRQASAPSDEELLIALQ
jgi:hypothetical protein